MPDFVLALFDTSSFPARWYCGDWTPLHGWVHILSDVGIWGAYTTIPIILIYFVRQRKDLPFPAIIWLFGAFIISCGFVHLVEAGIFWWPAYRFSATIKMITAIVSWLTVIALFRVIPYALRLPGLEKVNAELRHANHELEDFAHVVSHDLRAPLRGIRTVASWVAEDLKEHQGETRENLALLDNRVARMEQMIEGILAYSRLTHDVQPYRIVNTDNLIKNLLREIDIPASVKVHIEGPLPEVYGDETSLYRVFLNLLDNAVKYCNDKKEGHVWISAITGREGWEFLIGDNGCGIAPEHHERIFKMFQRLDPDGKIKGNGLGLAVVKKIVEQAGGRVWVESSKSGGAEFHFWWPKTSAR